MKETITVSITTETSIDKVWEAWTNPQHIVNWNHASDDWHTPKAENDLKVGGKFCYTMAAKDGSMQFNFEGIYDVIARHQLIAYTIADGRKVEVKFHTEGKKTFVTENFEAESTNSIELQKTGWQAILNNFKTYTESFNSIETLRFEIMIDASVEKVYTRMLDDHFFKEWTSVFNPTSHFVGNWEKNSRILFLGTDKEGKLGGMVGLVEENIRNKFVSIIYIGIIKDEKEITDGPEVEGWVGSHEKYFFTEQNGETSLVVEMDTNMKLKKYFLETYPLALDKLKIICEK